MGILDDPTIIGVRITLIDRCNSPRHGHYSFYKNNVRIVENRLCIDTNELNNKNETDEASIVLEAIDRAFKIANKKEQERQLKAEYDRYLELHNKFKNMDDSEILRLQKSREAIEEVQKETDGERYARLLPRGSYL